ncbi:MAG: carbamoyl-phosphate synthase large subunit, partial [bacterium]
SRSSALASKATGYPIAKLATKIALGYTLDEIKNDVTGKTYAFFEPVLDYVICKIPKWPFDKFHDASRQLGTQMKATGEVMAISDHFEGALLKALRSLESGHMHLYDRTLEKKSVRQLKEMLKQADDQRLFVIAEALRKGVSVQNIHDLTQIDIWFIWKIHNIVTIEQQLASHFSLEVLLEAKKRGFSDEAVAKYSHYHKDDIHILRDRFDIHARYKAVDTCAAEFDAQTPYYYSTYQGENEIIAKKRRKKILVLGSGPIRIGQGIEFDYCSVHCVFALKDAGYETIIVNNNPETVSTDFDIADRLYFEPLVEEDVEEIIRLEKPAGVIVQFGGQTAIKLTTFLRHLDIPILGTSAEAIDMAEDRGRFDQILERCHIKRPLGDVVSNTEEALETAERIGYPVLIRPSYVLGGAGMEIALNEDDIKRFMNALSEEHKKYPVLIDQYLAGKECEVDAICDGKGVLIPGIMEHVERAGVHSGDSISIYPPQKISKRIQYTIMDYTNRLAMALHVKGLINIQFIVYKEHVYVIEVNPRSSRTIPYISKVTGVPIVKLATRVIMGESITGLGYDYGLLRAQNLVAVKMPVFSFEKIKGAEISLGPEMKSTGEVLGLSRHAKQALYKAFLGVGIKMPETKNIIVTIKESAKDEFLPIAQRLKDRGYHFYATSGTCRYLQKHDIDCDLVNRINEGENTIIDLMMTGTIDFVVDIPTRNRNLTDGFLIRRQAVETGIPIYTSLDTLNALIDCLEEEGHELDLIDIAEIKV